MRKYLFIFILSGLFCNSLKAEYSLKYNENKKTSPILQFIGDFIKPYLETRLDVIILKSGFNSHLKNISDPLIHLKIEILKEGNREQKLICGQMAQISLNNQKEILINAGLTDIDFDLDLGIINMKIGEERLITKLNSPNNESFKVKLKKIIDNVYNRDLENFSLNDFKYYDIVTNLTPKITCGSLVKTSFKIFDAQGKILFQNLRSDPKYIIGSGSMPFILENGLIGMSSHDMRLIFIDSIYLKNLKIEQFIIQKIQENKGVILEITPEIVQ